MVKIVGKVTVFILSFCTFFLQAHISLELRNSDGIRTENIVAGQPFSLGVIIDEINGSVATPTVEGLERVTTMGTSMHMTTINGKSTIKYMYQIQIDQPGVYTIGPAHVMYQRQELVSDAIVITVGHETSSQLPTKGQKKANKELKAFLRLNIDTDNVVVGQKIQGTLRFYYQDPTISLTHLGEPDVAGFEMLTTGKVIGGTAEIDGTQYRYAEWKWDMYPKSAGEFVIPAYSADYELPVRDNHFLGSLFMFINTRAERKRVYSNAVKITVNPLPHTTLPVQAIGIFDAITASITPPVAKEGEGMVLTLEIVGNGNLHAIPAPMLNMPAALKYYESNVSVIEGTGQEMAKKRFEFIVQGMKAGDWEVPEQQFTYFDVIKHSYATLRTCALSVTIQPLSHKEVTAVDAGPENSTKKSEECEIIWLNTKGPWYPVAERQPLSWFIFHILFFAPLFYAGYPKMRHYSQRLLFYSMGGIKKRAFRAARKKINRCLDHGQAQPLCGIFIELFALLSRQISPHMSASAVEKYMPVFNLSEQESAQWKIFFDRLTRAAYADNKNENVYELCKVAMQWLDRLEK